MRRLLGAVLLTGCAGHAHVAPASPNWCAIATDVVAHGGHGDEVPATTIVDGTTTIWTAIVDGRGALATILADFDACPLTDAWVQSNSDEADEAAQRALDVNDLNGWSDDKIDPDDQHVVVPWTTQVDVWGTPRGAVVQVKVRP